MSVGGIVNADFCSGGDDLSPDSTLIEIMDQKGIDRESIKYRSVEYLVNVSINMFSDRRSACIMDSSN
jgi:hypothetical protein